VRFFLPLTLVVVTLITVTPKISSMAFFDLYFVRILGHFKHILLDVQVFHGLLGDDGPDDDIIR
jgi:hypothetical protein